MELQCALAADTMERLTPAFYSMLSDRILIQMVPGPLSAVWLCCCCILGVVLGGGGLGFVFLKALYQVVSLRAECIGLAMFRRQHLRNVRVWNKNSY